METNYVWPLDKAVDPVVVERVLHPYMWLVALRMEQITRTRVLGDISGGTHRCRKRRPTDVLSHLVIPKRPYLEDRYKFSSLG